MLVRDFGESSRKRCLLFLLATVTCNGWGKGRMNKICMVKKFARLLMIYKAGHCPKEKARPK